MRIFADRNIITEMGRMWRYWLLWCMQLLICMVNSDRARHAGRAPLHRRSALPRRRPSRPWGWHVPIHELSACRSPERFECTAMPTRTLVAGTTVRLAVIQIDGLHSRPLPRARAPPIGRYTTIFPSATVNPTTEIRHAQRTNTDQTPGNAPFRHGRRLARAAAQSRLQ